MPGMWDDSQYVENIELGHQHFMPDQKESLDQTLMDMRARCLSLGADLDRLDRSRQSNDQLQQFREALAILSESTPDRAERILMLFSDKTPAPRHGNK
jgi:hypothetical protein